MRPSVLAMFERTDYFLSCFKKKHIFQSQFMIDLKYIYLGLKGKNIRNRKMKRGIGATTYCPWRIIREVDGKWIDGSGTGCPNKEWQHCRWWLNLP